MNYNPFGWWKKPKEEDPCRCNEDERAAIAAMYRTREEPEDPINTYTLINNEEDEEEKPEEPVTPEYQPHTPNDPEVISINSEESEEEGWIRRVREHFNKPNPEMARQQNPKFRKHRNYETVDDLELQINRWVDKCNTARIKRP